MAAHQDYRNGTLTFEQKFSKQKNCDPNGKYLLLKIKRNNFENENEHQN